MPSARDVQRDRLAVQIGKLTYETLLGFGITRVADVTGLDRIGLPVYTSVRPAGRSISICSGKGITRGQARAGAILEATELWAAEQPHLHGTQSVFWGSWNDSLSGEYKYPIMPIVMAQFALDAPIHANTPIMWDTMYSEQKGYLAVPSDMVWMTQRVPAPFIHFQTSSNGLASGVSRKDAELSGLYEVVERDAWSISENLMEFQGQWPIRVSLDNLPYPLYEIVDAMFGAGLYPFLFDMTNDLQVPAFKCILCDPTDNSAGMFAGHGCSLNAYTSAKRALLEAAQSRACYIAGARDDLFRRQFLLLKATDQKKVIEQLSAIPGLTSMRLFVDCDYPTIEAEWKTLVDRLTTFGISEIYTKVLYENHDPDFTIVRVVTPQLEPPRFEHYKMGPRGKKALEGFK